jgi:hypothetical protein
MELTKKQLAEKIKKDELNYKKMLKSKNKPYDETDTEAENRYFGL